MSEPQRAVPAQLFVSVFSASPDLIEEAVNRLEGVLGPREEQSPLLPFDKTDYYVPEFGPNLVRRFVFFQKLFPQERIVAVKHLAWKIEKEFSVQGKRRVNIDPGYLLLERLVLVTFKNFSHRLYLGEGVYGEVTLIFRHGHYQPLPWTYPDYADEEVRALFRRMREKYRRKLRHVS